MMLTGESLAKLKLKALRAKVLYKLSPVKKAIIDCSINVLWKRRPKNRVLIRALRNIVSELLELINSFKFKVMKLGCKMAERMVKVALKLSIKEVFEWVSDSNYIYYLGIQQYYKPKLW